MLRIIAIVFGVVFIFVGVAGFLPVFWSNGLLFGYFEVNVVQNIMHIITGVLAIMAATSAYYARLFFQIMGIVYTIFAMLGFWRSDVLMMPTNTADNILHLVIAVIALYLGFAAKFKRP